MLNSYIFILLIKLLELAMNVKKKAGKKKQVDAPRKAGRPRQNERRVCVSVLVTPELSGKIKTLADRKETSISKLLEDIILRHFGYRNILTEPDSN